MAEQLQESTCFRPTIFFFNSVIRCFVEKLVISLELYKGGTAHIRIWDYNIIAFEHDSGKFRRTILPMHGILLLQFFYEHNRCLNSYRPDVCAAAECYISEPNTNDPCGKTARSFVLKLCTVDAEQMRSQDCSELCYMSP